LGVTENDRRLQPPVDSGEQPASPSAPAPADSRGSTPEPEAGVWRERRLTGQDDEESLPLPLALVVEVLPAE